MNNRGFTIVELLIVIVVIAILAVISVVAYNGIQQRARVSAASSGISQAKNKLELYKVDNGSYPASGNLASAGATNTDVDYQYTSNGTTYCLTGTAGNISYKASDTTSPTPGGCSGHGQGGVPAISNLVLDPQATGSNWFNEALTGSIARTYSVTWNGKANWARMASTGGSSSARLYLNESDLVDGSTYTLSFIVGNSGTATVSFSLDFCDNASPMFTVAPGEQKRVSFSAGIANYTNIYRFIDINLGLTDSNGLLITNGMITRGTTLYNYADGTSANWAWNGTTNNSTSTGPPL